MQLFVDDDNLFFPRILRHRSTKDPQEVKNKSRSTRTRFFFRFDSRIFCASPSFLFFFFFLCSIQRARERTRGCLSKRVKNISRRSNTRSRAFIHLKLPRVRRTAVFGRLFFSGRQRLNYSSCSRGGLRKNCRR